ncbi:MAG: ATP-binding protein [Campylobacterota bacterium]|nr:ATP-binding protein [Campylobacterota bacterium]
MLIRFIVNNLYSFGEEKEFNMLPAPRLSRLKEHKYTINNFEILKLASIYGANGAGKSNLIKALSILQDIVVKEKVKASFSNKKYKFHNEDEIVQTLIVEFIQDDYAYLYGLEIIDNTIITEELYESSLGQGDDKLLFERKTDKETKTSTLNTELLNDTEGKVLKNVIVKNLIKHNEPILKLLTTLDNEQLNNLQIPLKWFEETLQIISPHSKFKTLAHKIDRDGTFKDYVNDLMKSFHIGINNIKTEKVNIQDLHDTDVDQKFIDKIQSEFNDPETNMIGFASKSGKNQLVVTREDDEIYIKELLIEHIGKNGKVVEFDLEEESDGTARLLDFAPAFKQIIDDNRVFIIDEIERSIHPLLIKELVQKFSFDNKTKGQLIFTTHESNLLDQDIFRQDEIWFAEKDMNGTTDLYPLSDFKVHNTIDIRKGYLNGRYGSIPFLGNLKDLNWHHYDTEK